MARVCQTAPRGADDRQGGPGLPTADDSAGRGCAGVADLPGGGGRPGRFAKSKSVGAFFGLTPTRYQSGETDVTGGITRVGDASVRTALHDAANALLTRAHRFSTLKRWALDVAKRRGMRRAKVALARKLATVLHRMWADGTEFAWGKDPAAAAG